MKGVATKQEEQSLGSASKAVLNPKDVVRLYEEAFNANDADTMASLFLPDVVFVNFGGTIVHGRDRLHRAQALVFAQGGPLEHVSVRYRVESLINLSDEIAVLHARQRGLGPSGQLVDLEDDAMHAVLMLLIVRTSDGWRIRVGQNTPVRQ